MGLSEAITFAIQSGIEFACFFDGAVNGALRV